MKKSITVIIAISVLLIGCTNNLKNSRKNIELIEKYVQSVENRTCSWNPSVGQSRRKRFD